MKKDSRKKNKFLSVSYQWLTDDKLDVYDAIVLALIVSYSLRRRYCSATNGAIAEALGIHSDRVAKSIHHLEDQKLILVEGYNRRRKIIPQVGREAGTRFLAVEWRLFKDKRLGIYNLLVFAEIESKSKLKGFCFARNKVIAENLGMSKKQIEKSLQLLERIGAIKREGGNRKGENRERKITSIEISPVKNETKTGSCGDQNPMMEESKPVDGGIIDPETIDWDLISLDEFGIHYNHNIRY